MGWMVDEAWNYSEKERSVRIIKAYKNIEEAEISRRNTTDPSIYIYLYI
jgi:hypothetical protein